MTKNIAPYTAPKHLKSAFNCPRCGAYARQVWYDMRGSNSEIAHYVSFNSLATSVCENCGKASFWLREALIDPRTRGAPSANSDMNDDIIRDYEEAAKIEHDSPRGAAALLRLCVQKICRQLGLPGNNINDDIAALVKRGLPLQVKQALDVVRVLGNNAVHPGEIDLNETPEIVSALFILVNEIAERMITQPKAISALHSALPQSIQEAIKRRDEKALPAPPKRDS